MEEFKIIGPPHLVVNLETGKVITMHPCSDGNMLSLRKMADHSDTTFPGFIYRYKHWGPHHPDLFKPVKNNYAQRGPREKGNLMKKQVDCAGFVKKEDAHIAAINSFIPQAEAIANEKEKHGGDLWSKVFHKEMNRLTREAGLRR